MSKRTYTQVQVLLPKIREMIAAGKTQSKPKTFSEANELIDRYIYFYNNECIQNKTGVAPLTLRHSA